MPGHTAPPHGVMEGKGHYNRYARLPAGGAALALPLLEEAVRSLELDTNDQTVVMRNKEVVRLFLSMARILLDDLLIRRRHGLLGN